MVQTTPEGWPCDNSLAQLIRDMVYGNLLPSPIQDWPVPAPLDSIVDACCHPDPNLRPSLNELSIMVDEMVDKTADKTADRTADKTVDRIPDA
ncbi:hypothetical protein B0T22DRAFT_472502 [Podospora appendiculata]|uniref:Uncharacterized protein n=1 Tax=Podospora appendiculata TaxID=314037 RepID=A0AAE1C7G1_9PEZI|nr:hypothetical protein B0T22DRAFT_472502 [Podospora appendiculata]